VTEETLNDLLNLPGLRVTRYAIEEQDEASYLHLFCEHQHDVALCPRCQKVMAGGYDHKDRCVRHLDIWGQRTLAHFPRRRFDCRVCGKPFRPTVPWYGFWAWMKSRCTRDTSSMHWCSRIWNGGA